MPQTICIIQARRQSTRLPNKILLDLGGKPVLQHVIERCQSIRGVAHTVVAAPTGTFEDPVEELAANCGAAIFRGDMNDVLSRYWGASQQFGASYVMRVTSDCPLLDPELCGLLLEKCQHVEADYGGLSGWPHGNECEVFTQALLDRAHKHASHSADREHVTLWMKKQKDIKTTSFFPKNKVSFRSGNRWVVDYPEDYEFLKTLFSHFPPNGAPNSWQDILSFVEANPYLRTINQMREDEWVSANREIYRQSGQNWDPS